MSVGDDVVFFFAQTTASLTYNIQRGHVAEARLGGRVGIVDGEVERCEAVAVAGLDVNGGMLQQQLGKGGRRC